MDYDQIRRTLDEYFPRKQRTISRSYSTKKYNIIGFGTEDIIEYKHCPLDPGVRLIKIKGELKCPTCGYIYKKEEATNEEGISIKHNKQQTRIVTPKTRKKYYSKDGNLITDPDLIAEVQKGNTVISYHEELP